MCYFVIPVLHLSSRGSIVLSWEGRRRLVQMLQKIGPKPGGLQEQDDSYSKSRRKSITETKIILCSVKLAERNLI